MYVTELYESMQILNICNYCNHFDLHQGRDMLYLLILILSLQYKHKITFNICYNVGFFITCHSSVKQHFFKNKTIADRIEVCKLYENCFMCHIWSLKSLVFSSCSYDCYIQSVHCICHTLQMIQFTKVSEWKITCSVYRWNILIYCSFIIETLACKLVTMLTVWGHNKVTFLKWLYIWKIFEIIANLAPI